MNNLTEELPLHELQGIVLHGYGHLYEARFVLLSIRPGRAKDARRFLASLKLTTAATAARKAAEPGPFVNVAFTHRGLEALGLDSALLDNFPRDFVEGPTTEARARLLGDQGESRPSEWLWGAPAKAPVHAVLLAYAHRDIDSVCDDVLRDAADAGFEQVERLETIRLPRRQEHFGFRDGIAQPTIGAVPGNAVAAGEILLGHKNAFGEPAHVPGAPKSAFALNGTYAVLRQLEQDVRGFWSFCRAQGSSDGDAVRFASQMVGRWPSGAPLVKHAPADGDPRTDAASNDNDFEYAMADAKGLRCPFGAHIRRSNPRDWGTASSAKECRTVVSRHRIIRRGRAYGSPLCPDAEPLSYLKALDAPDPRPNRGLHFLCFNANIEQQFEFVQRQWCNNPKFAGLVNGVDPLIGDHRRLAGEEPAFSIQRELTAERVKMPARFVRTRGAAYLFMPTVRAVASLAES